MGGISLAGEERDGILVCLGVQECWAHWEEHQLIMLVGGGGFGGHCVRRRRAGAAIVGFGLGVMLERWLEDFQCETARIWYITCSIRAVA